ncbi:MAG: YbaN family protein [Actinomycetota bacterium]
MSVEQPALRPAGRVARAVWLVAGLLAVAVGAVGIVVPGLPTTVCFIVAAWCFSRSSERLERWVLDLPRIGPMVRDHRAGLGMPRRAKVIAISMIVVAVALSVTFGIDAWPIRAVVLALGAVGVLYIAVRVPTRERVLRERERSGAGVEVLGRADVGG